MSRSLDEERIHTEAHDKQFVERILPLLPGSSADALSGAAFPAPREVSSGAAGVCARTGGLAVVQRSAHDMASLQYQRMSAHA